MKWVICLFGIFFLFSFHRVFPESSSSQDILYDMRQTTFISIPQDIPLDIAIQQYCYLEKNGLWGFIFHDGVFSSSGVDRKILLSYRPTIRQDRKICVGAMRYGNKTYFLDPFQLKSGALDENDNRLSNSTMKFPLILVPYPQVAQEHTMVNKKNIGKEIALFQLMKNEYQKKREAKALQISIFKVLLKCISYSLLLLIALFSFYYFFVYETVQTFFSQRVINKKKRALKKQISELQTNEIQLYWGRIITLFKETLSSYVVPSQTLEEIDSISGEQLKKLFSSYEELLNILINKGYCNGHIADYKKACLLLIRLIDELDIDKNIHY